MYNASEDEFSLARAHVVLGGEMGVAVRSPPFHMRFHSGCEVLQVIIYQNV